MLTRAVPALTVCGGTAAMPAQRRCGGDSDEVVAAANKERSVLLYASYNPVNMEELKKAFESECPAITLESVRGTDAELNPKPRSSGLTPGDVAEYTAMSCVIN